MSEISNVIPGEPVAVEWGNDIRDRVLQRYASVTQRSTLTPTPEAGELSYLSDSGAVEVYHSGAWRAFLPPGVVLPYAGTTVPPGFLVCNGALVSRSTYAALFAAVGTAYGAGDGSTTFAVPDMRQRFPLGVAASGVGSTIGQSGGQIDHSHSNPATASGGSHNHDQGSTPSGGGGANVGNTSLAHTHGNPSTGSGGSHSHSFSDTTGNPSVLNTSYGSGGLAATSNHTHAVAGSTSSTGGHSHAVGDTESALGLHSHVMANHVHDLGSGALDGVHSHTQGPTGSANPPFLALNYIIRT